MLLPSLKTQIHQFYPLIILFVLDTLFFDRCNGFPEKKMFLMVWTIGHDIKIFISFKRILRINTLLSDENVMIFV
jgi:hypothetical protein